MIGRHGTAPPTKREQLLEKNQWMLGELEDLVQQVETTARRNAPSPAWAELRQRIYRLRVQLRDLRESYLDVGAP